MLKARKRVSRSSQSVDDLDLPSEQPPLSHNIEHEDKIADIQSALEQLPDDQQEALELIFYRGMTGPEAAAYVGISLNTLKSRLFRARRTLRGLLKKEDNHHV
jgi:RNA polymerase sigma-70 factor (ECF subfamily)